MWISVLQPVRNISIAVFAGISAFAHLRRLNVIITWRVKRALSGLVDGKLLIAAMK